MGKWFTVLVLSAAIGVATACGSDGNTDDRLDDSVGGGCVSDPEKPGGGQALGELLFEDPFEQLLDGWEFDMTNTEASYSIRNGALEIDAGSEQAFAWYPAQANWGSETVITVGLRLADAMVAGILTRVESFPIGTAEDCNLREDFDRLRAARHISRGYADLNVVPTTVEFDREYQLRASIDDDGMRCELLGGPSVEVAHVITGSTGVGLFVYEGLARFESFTVRKAVID